MNVKEPAGLRGSSSAAEHPPYKRNIAGSNPACPATVKCCFKCWHWFVDLNLCMKHWRHMDWDRRCREYEEMEV